MCMCVQGCLVCVCKAVMKLRSGVHYVEHVFINGVSYSLQCRMLRLSVYLETYNQIMKAIISPQFSKS